MCMDGAPWMKPTVLLANCRCVESLDLRCDGGHGHVACSHWRGFAHAVVHCWFRYSPDEQSVIDRSIADRAGFVGDMDDETLDNT